MKHFNFVGSKHGFRPVCIFGRKAKVPLSSELNSDVNSWEMLGTNLSLQSPNGTWTTDTSRLDLPSVLRLNQQILPKL